MLAGSPGMVPPLVCTQAKRAPSRQAFVVRWYMKRNRPYSKMPKSIMNSMMATNTNSTVVAPPRRRAGCRMTMPSSSVWGSRRPPGQAGVDHERVVYHALPVDFRGQGRNIDQAQRRPTDVGVGERDLEPKSLILDPLVR